jgi:hypothetical protein
MTFGRTVACAAHLTMAVIAACGVAEAEDSSVAPRDEFIARSLRAAASRFCPTRDRICCVSLPSGWSYDGIMSRLRDVPQLRRSDAEVLPGGCDGEAVYVQRAEWPKPDRARVDIYVGQPLLGYQCSYSLVLRSGKWSVSKSACELFSAL